MQQSEFKDFTAMLDATCSLLSRGAYMPNPASTVLFFNTLRAYPFDVVRAAFSAHCADPQRGKFAPVPADIIAQIEQAASKDGRPEADEAWAIALRAADEAATVVWTEEIAAAWSVCLPVLFAGDEVGARMAFKAAYARCITEAREGRRSIVWSASMGSDKEQREIALAAASEAGRLAIECEPPAKIAGLLELAEAKGCPAQVMDKLKDIKARILNPEPWDSIDVIERRRTEEAKRLAAEKVAAYTKGNL